MPKANLDRCWSYEGRAYGPGEDDIPQGLHDILSEKGRLPKGAEKSSLESISVADLKKMARKQGLEGTEKMKKPALLAALKG